VGRLHREMEERIAASGMAWTVLRPNYLMQNVLWLMADDIRRENAFYDSLGARPVSMIDARDIGAAAARVLTEPGHEGRAYELSGPAAIDYHQAAAILSDALGRPIRYVEVDDDTYRARLVAKGVPDHYVDFLVDVNRQAREGLTRDDRVTSSVADITGHPPTPFLRFCQDHAQSFSP
jgi:uncharacterized protein YbjT (DUF2867 family)